MTCTDQPSLPLLKPESDTTLPETEAVGLESSSVMEFAPKFMAGKVPTVAEQDAMARALGADSLFYLPVDAVARMMMAYADGTFLQREINEIGDDLAKSIGDEAERLFTEAMK